MRSQPPIWSHMPLIATFDKQQKQQQNYQIQKREVPSWYPSGTHVISYSLQATQIVKTLQTGGRFMERQSGNWMA